MCQSWGVGRCFLEGGKGAAEREQDMFVDARRLCIMSPPGAFFRTFLPNSCFLEPLEPLSTLVIVPPHVSAVGCVVFMLGYCPRRFQLHGSVARGSSSLQFRFFILIFFILAREHLISALENEGCSFVIKKKTLEYNQGEWVCLGASCCSGPVTCACPQGHWLPLEFVNETYFICH